ncbi:MAG: tRNA (adenosine(37)-N6)-threonylcarbamoyltransferase complex dimerization subunit type 1 TsaB [Alicyclobacillaceae bacterium]|nr:tRNA (adenosine(37)-N6)-threonylcarbamoyltransferase complex dimerization subunit type 1 TsaB [Alicyclobacillaceae bacterium]
MVVLAADTATEVMAAALGRIAAGEEGAGGVDLMAATALLVARGHSRLLQPSLAGLLQACGVAPAALSALAVGVGPGSYTGVRIGVATVKAMAFALGVPVYPLSTLWALAEAAVPGAVRAAGEPLLVMPLLYARRQRAYGALFAKSRAGWRCLAPAAVRPVSEWVAAFQAQPGSAAGVVVHDLAPGAPGSGAGDRDAARAAVMSARAGRTVDIQAVAGDLGPALLRLAACGQVAPVFGEALHGLVPEYVLPVEAEAKLNDRGGAG